ncbi:MAG TPA: hypothetical protein VF184_03260 [Phycisphaeraceae bacterium]
MGRPAPAPVAQTAGVPAGRHARRPRRHGLFKVRRRPVLAQTYVDRGPRGARRQGDGPLRAGLPPRQELLQ